MSRIKYPYAFNRQIREQAKMYSKIKLIGGVINGIVIPLMFFAVFFYGGFSSVTGIFIDSLEGDLIVRTSLFIIIFTSLLTIVQFPLRFYSGFIYEHKYGLSNYTVRGWLKDFLKMAGIGYIFSLVMLGGLYFLLQFELWWIYASVAYFVITVLFTNIMPLIIMPLFYKIEPYKNKNHVRRLLGMIKKAGVGNIGGIFVVNESKKSKKPNAMFTGIGKIKRIVMFDTLVKNFTSAETEIVIAHEVGHYVNKDIHRFILIDTLKIIPIFLIVDYALKAHVGFNGIVSISDITTLPLFMLVFSLIEIVLMPMINTYSRKREAEADLFALNVCKKPVAQASTERRLADMSLGENNPHPLVEFFFHTHPSADKRIKMCKEWKRH